MRLTLGPILFNWAPETFTDFYARIADEADVDRVVIGEVVCSKRAPFVTPLIPEAVERLARAGKEVVLAAPALVTLKRERKALSATAAGETPIEINDLTALRHIAPGAPFSVGPMVNVYNEGSLAYLVGRGATDVCLPPELPISAVRVLASEGRRYKIGVEVWGWGRMPLAISARCYHARLKGLAKDNCQFVCDADPDGRAVETLDGQPFLAINGVQTLSDAYANLAADVPALADAGVTALRLSPHTGDMVAVAKVFRGATTAKIAADEALATLAALGPGRRPSNGFLFGKSGADWTH